MKRGDTITRTASQTALITPSGGLRILGCDPGLALCGFGVIDVLAGNLKLITAGVIKTPKELPVAERLKIIRQDAMILLNQYKPNVLAIEQLFFFRNAKSMVPVAEARGVILEAAASLNIPVVEYTPSQIKQCLTDSGKADKAAMQLAVQRTFQHDSIIKPDDAADGVAIAICHARNVV